MRSSKICILSCIVNRKPTPNCERKQFAHTQLNTIIVIIQMCRVHDLQCLETIRLYIIILSTFATRTRVYNVQTYIYIYITYTFTCSADVGRQHVLLGRCFRPPPPASAVVFLDAEGVTGLGRTGIPDARATALGLCGTAAVADDLRPVAMSLANTMAAAAGAPDTCSATPRLRAAADPVVPSRVVAPFNSSPTTLGGPADRWPCRAPGDIVNIIAVNTRAKNVEQEDTRF